jgi:putative tryptophan/tyrosine transport system substrate-binding protein
MRRRDFIARIAGLATWPLAARAQQPDWVRHVGVLMAYAESDSAAQSWLAAFRGALAKMGWTEGSNLRIELRWGTGNADKIRTLAKELVDLRPDAILSQTTSATGALAHETRTIPIVFVNVADPIASGFAASLARPGGNVTGFALFESTVGGKWMGLLKEIAPRTVRVALLFNPATAVLPQIYIPSIQAAASSYAVQASTHPVHAKDEIEGVIATQARNPGGSVIVMLDPFKCRWIARIEADDVDARLEFRPCDRRFRRDTHLTETYSAMPARPPVLLHGKATLAATGPRRSNTRCDPVPASSIPAQSRSPLGPHTSKPRSVLCCLPRRRSCCSGVRSSWPCTMMLMRRRLVTSIQEHLVGLRGRIGLAEADIGSGKADSGETAKM